jgi:Tfp pilus assembly protein PilN
LIEVNLLPSGKKRSSRGRGFSPTGGLPSLKPGAGGFPGDPYTVFAIVASVLSVLVMVWLFFGVRSDREETQVLLDQAVQDSIRFADLIERTNQLTARRDSIAQRVSIIQEIDAGRYIWPHILDEVSRALPDYTWLREITQLGEDPLELRIGGRAGSMFAITGFMRNLEASPFLRAVQMERAEQTQSEEDEQDIVYVFEFLVNYEQPPLDMLETVPLFENEMAMMPAVTRGGS